MDHHKQESSLLASAAVHKKVSDFNEDLKARLMKTNVLVIAQHEIAV